jgi:hypothetical protein
MMEARAGVEPTYTDLQSGGALLNQSLSKKPFVSR